MLMFFISIVEFLHFIRGHPFMTSTRKGGGVGPKWMGMDAGRGGVRLNVVVHTKISTNL